MKRAVHLILTSLLTLATVPIPSFAAEGLYAAPPGSLGEKVIRVMETVSDYTDLLALYEKQMKIDDAAGEPSARGRKLLARLNRLRTVAGSASTIDPENPTGPKVVNFVWGRG